jgi:glycosyltransferase involved in cell wall biosynthesis
VKAHGIPDVYFLGFRNQSELPKLYASADVFVLPAEDEPWGLVINEAMCAGLPVVATREIGAVADLVVDGWNGLLFETGAVAQLADHIRALAADPIRRDAMGARSRQRISDWNLDRCVSGVRAALASTCGTLETAPGEAPSRLALKSSPTAHPSTEHLWTVE